LSYSKVQTIPVDAEVQLRHAVTGTDQAAKIQNLNTLLYINDVDTAAASITTTVAQIIAPTYDEAGDLIGNAPCYRVTVSGWSDEPVDPTVLYVVGGFPRSPNNAQNVNSNLTVYVNSNGLLQLYPATLTSDAVTPTTYVIPNTTLVSMLDADNDVAFPYWLVEIGAYLAGQTRTVNFQFSFDLPILP
jgi:hypothetical protein